jgi:hypothetical protein
MRLSHQVPTLEDQVVATQQAGRRVAQANNHRKPALRQ